MKIIIIYLLCIVTVQLKAQKVILEKKANNNAALIAIEGKDAKTFIKNYIETHKLYNEWVNYVKQLNFFDRADKSILLKINFLISVTDFGAVQINMHKYSDNEEVETEEYRKLCSRYIEQFETEIMSLIASDDAVIRPRYSLQDKKYITDEFSIDCHWLAGRKKETNCGVELIKLNEILESKALQLYNITQIDSNNLIQIKTYAEQLDTIRAQIQNVLDRFICYDTENERMPYKKSLYQVYQLHFRAEDIQGEIWNLVSPINNYLEVDDNDQKTRYFTHLNKAFTTYKKNFKDKKITLFPNEFDKNTR